MSWDKSVDGGIAQTWHNVDGAMAPAEWLQPVASIRGQAPHCADSGPPERAVVNQGGWARTVLPWQHAGIDVGCRLASYPDGVEIRQAYAAVPRSADLSAFMAALPSIALAFEDQEPAFHAIVGEEASYVAHLFWPRQWDSLPKLLAASRATPVGPAHVCIHELDPKKPAFTTHATDEFRDRVPESAAPSDWFYTLGMNLKVTAMAVIYLDLQVGRDLFHWQVSDAADGILGRLHGPALISEIRRLLPDRLGACDACGHCACPRLSPDSKVTKDLLESSENPRQAQDVLVFPLSQHWWHGRFRYICPRCMKKSHEVRCLPIVAPAPTMQNPWSFLKSFTALGASEGTE
jgi:hypothetical protein